MSFQGKPLASNIVPVYDGTQWTLGGVSPQPFFGVRYVDLNNTSGSPNGSQAAPFTTVAAALASFTGPELALQLVTIYLAPADYTGSEPTIAYPSTTEVALIGLTDTQFTGGSILLGTIDMSNVQNAFFQRMNVAGIVTTTGNAQIIIGQDTHFGPITGDINSLGVEIYGSAGFRESVSVPVIYGNITCADGVIALKGVNAGNDNPTLSCPHINVEESILYQVHCQDYTATRCTLLLGFPSIDAADVVLTDCIYIGGDAQITGSFLARRTTFQTGTRVLSTGTEAAFYGCVFPASLGNNLVVFSGSPGIVTFDAISLTSFLNSGMTIINGEILLDGVGTMYPITLTGTANDLILTHKGKLVQVSEPTTTTLTVPDDSVLFEIGDVAHLCQVDVGQLVIAAVGGVTILTESSLKLRDQNSIAQLVKVDSNTWRLTGDLATPPLNTELWVDAATTAQSRNGSLSTPFATITEAVAAVTNGTRATLRVLYADYTAEAAVAIGTRKLSFIGEGTLTSPATAARPLLPVFNGGGELSFVDCTPAAVGTTTAVVSLQLRSSNVPGNIHVTTNLNLTDSSQAGTVTVDGSGGGGKVTAVRSSLVGNWNIAGGGNGATNAPQVDEATLSSLLFNGCKRTDASPDWNVTHQLFAHMQDAGRTIDETYYGAVISTSTLTATRTLSVTQTSMAVGAQLRIDRYDASNQQITVQGGTSGTVNLTNAGLVRHRYLLNNNTGPVLTFSTLSRLAQG